MNEIRVAAPARLHMGMFDLAGSLGRRFGGIGVAINQPQVDLTAAPSKGLQVEGPEAERARIFAERYLKANNMRPEETGAHIVLSETIPAHAGLGSGTKLGLAVAHALATLYDQPTDPYVLAQAVGRGSRSAIGLWTFSEGGFVVEGGQWPPNSEFGIRNSELAPLLARYPMPPSWRCVLAIPQADPGLSGESEHSAFEQLSPPREQAAAIAHLVLMSLLPALVEERLEEFGAALTRVQQLVGESFSPVQGDRFANPQSAELIAMMLDWGAAGAGQSSWGPAVYGLVEGDEEGRRLLAHIETIGAARRLPTPTAAVGGIQAATSLVRFDNDGVQVQYL